MLLYNINHIIMNRELFQLGGREIKNQLFSIYFFIQDFSLNPLDPMDHPSSMRYFPRISQNSLKISPKFRANIQIQSPAYAYLFIKTI